MRCPHCASTDTRERRERTELGYRRFRCRGCRCEFNERTGTRFNHLQYPTDIVCLMVLWRVRYKQKQPTASPLQASLEQLKGLPPALGSTGEFDVLRDEREDYAAKLNKAGVKVTAIHHLGTIHEFVMLHMITDTPAARNAIAMANAHLLQVFLAIEQKTTTA
jgi:acetyl esterase/lipase